MLKLYFKKLFSMLLDMVIVIIVYNMFFNLTYTLSNFFVEQKAKNVVLFGIPFIIMLIVIHGMRLRNGEKRRLYLNSVGEAKLNFKSELRYMLSYSEFHAELLSFATIVLPLALGMALTIDNDVSTALNLFVGFIVLCFCVALFAFFDFLLWVLVHTKWKKISDSLKQKEMQ